MSVVDKKTVEQLKKTSAYPYEVKGVDYVETHISQIFLAGEYVYKVKKDVKFSFLDFSTLAKRKEHCKNELELNRRLCRNMYLEVVPITKKGQKYQFEGEGDLIDYAVKMRRMPAERRMDLLLENNEVSEADIDNIAIKVAKFHNSVKIIDDKLYGSPELIREQVDDLKNHKKTIQTACKMGSKVDFALSKCSKFYTRNYSFFKKRQENGMIRNCHGDLHSANIFLTDKIYIFDCIEFNEDFRYIDVASEIAFMAMDLDAFGKEELSQKFIRRYTAFTKDRVGLILLNYYKCYRANVRAKIAAIEYSQKANKSSKERIIKYCNLMEKYAKRL